MKVDSHSQAITVTIIDRIHLDAHEAAFLRVMAKFCVEAKLFGSAACERLVEVLDAANVPTYDGGPVYGLFEAEETNPALGRDCLCSGCYVSADGERTCQRNPQHAAQLK